MKAKVIVKLKNGVLDPQGKAIHHAAQSLGLQNIEDVKVGKIFEVQLQAKDASAAKDELKQLSEKLLANTVIENFEVEIIN